MPTDDAHNSPEPVWLRVDRTRALVRAAWRLILAGGIIGAGYLTGPEGMEAWGWLWRSERAMFVAVATLEAAAAAAALGLLVGAVRWAILACWPKSLRLEIGPQEIALHVGPFGSGRYPWPEIRVEISPDVDPQFIERMPDDALAVSLRHPACHEDLAKRIERLAGVESERLTRLLRPHLEAAIRRGSDEDRRLDDPISTQPKA